eukprot:1015665-Amphidinium_carterae.1
MHVIIYVGTVSATDYCNNNHLSHEDGTVARAVAFGRLGGLAVPEVPRLNIFPGSFHVKNAIPHLWASRCYNKHLCLGSSICIVYNGREHGYRYSLQETQITHDRSDSKYGTSNNIEILYKLRILAASQDQVDPFTQSLVACNVPGALCTAEDCRRDHVRLRKNPRPFLIAIGKAYDTCNEQPVVFVIKTLQKPYLCRLFGASQLMENME